MDWPQPVRTKILNQISFNLAGGRVRSSHTLNLPHAHAHLRSLRELLARSLSELYGSLDK